MLTIITGTDLKLNRHEVLRLLSLDIQAKKNNCILMVPELISHQMERELLACCGNTASRYAEVLSFTRLADRVASYTGNKAISCLDGGGRIVAMAAALRQLHSKLKTYASIETKPEFLSGILDMIDEFKRCAITPADLMDASGKTEGLLAQKLEELSLIMEAYNAVCSQGKRDPRDLMDWLLDQLEMTDFAADHTFYFDGFPDYSKQHMDILQHIMSNSANVVISVTCDCPGSGALAFEKAGETAKDILRFASQNNIAYEVISLSPNNSALGSVCAKLYQGDPQKGEAEEKLHVFHTECIQDECNAVIERIYELVSGGCRYRDISIVCTDLNRYSYPLQAVAQRAHIPLYLAGTESVLEKNVIQSVISALDAAISGFGQKEVFRYMKSILSPLEPYQCDQVENYAILWSVDGGKWLQSWDKHPKGLNVEWTAYHQERLQTLNDYRVKLITPLYDLRTAFKSAQNVRHQVIALYDFLNTIELKKCLQRYALKLQQQGDHRNAQIMNQLWEILLSALEQLHDVLADAVWDTDTFVRLLKLLLSQYNVGTIPAVLDAVTAGSVSALRCHSVPYVFVLGASEGSFPSYGNSAGLLNDQERSLLLKLGVPLNPGAIDGLQTQFSEIYEVICSATEAIDVYYSDAQPSFVTKRLAVLAGDDVKITPRLGPALIDSVEAAAVLNQNLCSDLAHELGIEQIYDAITASKTHQLGRVGQNHILSLYKKNLDLSASQIDKLAGCRFDYFLRYGLHANERKIVSIDPAEFGTYVHAVLEDCARAIVDKGGFKKVSLDETIQLATAASERYFNDVFSQIDSKRMQYHFEKNTRELMVIVSELWNEMQDTDFEVFKLELEFGNEGEMPAVPISGNLLNVQLQGKVDRVDVWDDGHAKYVRIVDYKTGSQSFDYCDVFNGLGLQLFLYLYALEDQGQSVLGKKPQIAGVEYFPASVPYVLTSGAISQEDADKLHSTSFKRKGLILSDEYVLHAMENSDPPVRLPYTRRKDGSISGDIASIDQFKLLKKHIYSILKKLVTDIESGNVEPNPYTRGSDKNVCKYCPYGTICHSAQVEGRRNYQAMKANRFWEEMSKEV